MKYAGYIEMIMGKPWKTQAFSDLKRIWKGTCTGNHWFFPPSLLQIPLLPIQWLRMPQETIQRMGNGFIDFIWFYKFISIYIYRYICSRSVDVFFAFRVGSKWKQFVFMSWPCGLNLWEPKKVDQILKNGTWTQNDAGQRTYVWNCLEKNGESCWPWSIYLGSTPRFL